MRNVVVQNPEDRSYNVSDLEQLRLSKLTESMKQSGREEIYEAHVQVYMNLLTAQEQMTGIEPYWAGIVGDNNKRDAANHLRQVATQRLLIEKQRAALGALKPKKIG
jgi:hypothetical protein